MYRYRITVESLSGDATPETLQFEAENHDNLFDIVRRGGGKVGLEGDEAKAFVVGLKLFGEVVLKHRTREPFSIIKPAMGEFMKALKGQPRAAAEQPVATDSQEAGE